LVVVVVRPPTTITIILPVMVVPVVVVPVVESRLDLMGVKEVQVHQDKVMMVHDQVSPGIQLVVGVPVVWVMAETDKVVLIPHHTGGMV
jgi:hypothetical protein